MFLAISVVFVLVSVTHQCCSPPIWEGEEISLVSVLPQGETKPHIIQNDYKAYYDSIRKMLVLTGTTIIDGSNHNMTRIQDYNKKTEYIISDGTCNKGKLQDFQGNCIPANATKSDTYLATGNISMPIQVYSYFRDGLQISMTVDTNCVPIGQTFYGNQGFQTTFGSTSFSNIVARFGFDSEVFKVPDICFGDSSHCENGNLIQNIIDLAEQDHSGYTTGGGLVG